MSPGRGGIVARSLAVIVPVYKNAQTVAELHRRVRATVESARMRAAGGVRGKSAEGADGNVRSPMPGKVVKVLVGEGDAVAAGVPVVVVEAMKMENELASTRAGVVQKVHVKPGDAVEGGARLVTVG